MAQSGSENLVWAQGWGVVRQVHEKIEFIAFFDTQAAAEAAVAEAGLDCEVCWLSYKGGLILPPERDSGV
jgi:hypothetical protein